MFCKRPTAHDAFHEFMRGERSGTLYILIPLVAIRQNREDEKQQKQQKELLYDKIAFLYHIAMPDITLRLLRPITTIANVRIAPSLLEYFFRFKFRCYFHIQQCFVQAVQLATLAFLFSPEVLDCGGRSGSVNGNGVMLIESCISFIRLLDLLLLLSISARTCAAMPRSDRSRGSDKLCERRRLGFVLESTGS